MTYEEYLEKSKGLMGKVCKSCPICNGRACGNKIPGPGAKGTGTVAIENYNAWQRIYVNMDTLYENEEVDTTFNFFGKTFKYPIFAGPVGAVNLHYGDSLDDTAYNARLVKECKEAGIAAFTGDGINPVIMQEATKIIKENQGIGIPTIKPWDEKTYEEKLQLSLDSGSFAVAMDIDAAGLPFLKGRIPPAGRKSEKELKQIIDRTPVPFIVKGVMSVSGALKAKNAGAAAIVVSNHGGRVLDGTPGTATVLREIVEAVDGSMKVFVDGGIRSGVDIFKALALGADAVLIARPFVNMIYAGQGGVDAYVTKLGNELKDTMEMCGAKTLEDITIDKIRM